MPGDDFVDSTQTVLGEVGELPHLVELPARGVHAAMIGRTLALVSDLGADLQPAGWRLVDAPGIDHRRARSLLAQDLDRLEELVGGHHGDFKVQVVGPWTLAAAVERPRGDKVLGDHGARRDLGQALAEGLRAHVVDVQRRLPGASLLVQIDEPALPAVLAGAVPTISGFHRLRSVTAAEAAAALDWVCDAVTDAGATPVLHCCADELPWPLLAQTRVQAVSFDLSRQPRSSYDDLAGWVDGGRQVWVGAIPSVEPGGTEVADTEVTRTVLAWWSKLGYTDPESVPGYVVTPACGLAAASPSWARHALGLTRRVAHNLSEVHGRIEP